MIFEKREKVFSLARTAAAVPRGDLTKLFEEFYCYLLVAGLYREGEGEDGIHWVISNISDKQFDIPSGCYNSGLARYISKGLKDRYTALWNHPDLSQKESDIIASLDAIFTPNVSQYAHLTGQDLLSVAISRNFSDSMKVIAHYVSVAFGQYDYASPISVPRLYLSVFGNIHLTTLHPSNESSLPDTTTVLNTPVLRYGAKTSSGENVTALWAIVSAQIDSLAKATYPGDVLGSLLGGLGFLTQGNEFEKSIPIPNYVNSLTIGQMMGVGGSNPVSFSAMFYKDFLFGTPESIMVSRQALFIFIINVMMEKMGESRLSHLFAPNSPYRKLTTTTRLYGKTPKQHPIFQFALESLDPDLLAKKDVSTDDTTLTSEDPAEDPQDEDGGYDPSAPIPQAPMGQPAMDKDTIDLISFDKSGEGVNEDLYRQAVVALNDRLRSDDTLPISADVRDKLSYWVSGWIYRTAISATKDQIAFLNLQSYLKNISTPKG